MQSTLREDQERGIEMLREAFREKHRRIMFQAPTGYGKTVMAAAITELVRNKGQRLLFTVPMISLIDQTVERFAAEGLTAVDLAGRPLDIGVIQADHPLEDWMRPVQIASVQTLMKRGGLPEFDIAVVDEAHKWFDYYTAWFPECPKPIIGMSATPWTKGLGKHFTKLVKPVSMRWLVHNSLLAASKVYGPEVKADLTKVKTVAGDYHEGELAEAMSEDAIVGDVVATWLKRAEGRSTLCYAVNRAHAKLLQKRFEAVGVSVGYVDAFTSREERAKIRDDFHASKVKVVVSIGAMTTGVDWDVRCISLARPTKSEMLFVQIMGRGKRTADGKEDLLVLDHTDNHVRLGFPEDIDEAHTKLHTGKAPSKAEKEARARQLKLPKECPACKFIKPLAAHACPQCGFAPEPQYRYRNIDGDLAEIKTTRLNASRETKQRWLSELVWIEQQKRYKPGWARVQFMTKFKHWPDGLWECPVPAEREVLAYVKSRLIAFRHSAKGREPNAPTFA